MLGPVVRKSDGQPRVFYMVRLRSMASFNTQSRPHQQWLDLLVQDWVYGGHSDASLIEHATKQYDASFRFTVSARPWARSLADQEVELGNRVGYVWHACWYFKGGRFFDLAQFWRDIADVKDCVMLVCADSPSSLQVSFSPLEDQQQVSNVISRSFVAALENIRFIHYDQDHIAWARSYANLDPRVHAGTPWAALDPAMVGCSVFGA